MKISALWSFRDSNDSYMRGSRGRFILQRETFLNLLESLSEHAWQKNLETNESYTSAKFWQALGYDSKSLPLSTEAVESLLNPDDAELATEEVALHLKSGEPLELEVRVRAADGEWRFIRVRGCVTERNGVGDPAVIGGIVNDLTEEILTARRERRAKELVATLSRRERQVLVFLLEGAANKKIAYALGLSTRTVECYHARLLDKLGVRGTAELVQLALTAGLKRKGAQICG